MCICYECIYIYSHVESLVMGAGIRYVGSIFIGLVIELKVKDRVKGKREKGMS